MDEYLWPARNVAEYAYCPRLFYLMEVEGVHLANADTERGQLVHRYVDAPSHLKDEEEDPDKPKAVRSLTLSSQLLGLTATLDLAEIQGDRATPVEYRKGRPRYDQPPSVGPDVFGEEPPPPQAQPWPTDRVQLGLQSLLLKEHGYVVKQAVLYYASERRRVEVSINDELLVEALATLNTARHAATGPRPEPLLHDVRCLRCSLQPLCLPDEVQFQRRHETDISPRKIWPLRDDATHVIVQTAGHRVGVAGAALKVTDHDGKLIKQIPIVEVESLCLMGYAQVSTQALHVLADHEIPVAYMTTAGRLVAMVEPQNQVSALVRRAQAAETANPTRQLALARALIRAKIINQRTMLMRNHPALPPSVAPALADLVTGLECVQSSAELLGMEGQAASLYFQYFGGMFKGPESQQFEQHGRMRRPPPDPINASLSMAYMMLVHDCVTGLRLAGLDPGLGAFHVPRPGRPALALDLMEPFRPLVADSMTLSAFNRGEYSPGHFNTTAAGCMLTDDGRRTFFNAYGRRIDTEVTHPVFGYCLSYRRMIYLHARLLAAWFIGELNQLDFLTTR
ncbi:MAG: CRISPR-associated endonuclease Cas1 [Phycisphaerae bacterium]